MYQKFLNLPLSSIQLSLWLMIIAHYGWFIVTNSIIFFPSLKSVMLTENHSVLHAKTRFATVEKSIKFLLEIIPLVSSANVIGSALEFICNGMSFM